MQHLYNDFLKLNFSKILIFSLDPEMAQNHRKKSMGSMCFEQYSMCISITLGGIWALGWGVSRIDYVKDAFI